MSEMLQKVTLDSGKTVLLKSLQVKFYKAAIEAASIKAGDNQTLLAVHMQDEILKLLLVAIDNKDLDNIQKEKIEELFSPIDYRQVMMVVEKMVGEAKMPKVEMVSR